MAKKKPSKRADNKLPQPRLVDEAREADFYARKVGITKAEALKIIREAKSTPLKVR